MYNWRNPLAWETHRRASLQYIIDFRIRYLYRQSVCQAVISAKMAEVNYTIFKIWDFGRRMARWGFLSLIGHFFFFLGTEFVITRISSIFAAE